MRGIFNDLIARVLAADPGDPAAIGRLAEALQVFIFSLEKGTPSKGLLQLALRAVRQVETDRPANSAKLMEAVASAAARQRRNGLVTVRPRRGDRKCRK